MASETELQQKAMEKAYRSQVRLHYAILADMEIGRNLEEFRETIKRAIHTGQEVRLRPAEVTINGDSVQLEIDAPSE